MSSLIYFDCGKVNDHEFCEYGPPGYYTSRQSKSYLVNGKHTKKPMTENGESIEEFVDNIKRQAYASAVNEIRKEDALEGKPDPYAFGPRRSPFLPSLAKGDKKFSALFRPSIDRKDRK